MDIIIGSMAVGAVIGVLSGLAMAMFTPDGVWPGVWAGLVLAFTVLGAVLGTIEWLIG
jgi:hypothetical protein